MVQASRDIARAHHKSTSAAALPTVGYLLLDAALMLASALCGLAIMAFVPS